MADRLKGKVALVVGAGSIGPGWGNGKATAVAFAREGARVFCADINQAAAEETARSSKTKAATPTAHRADVSKAADVAAMVEACVSTFGRIDVLDNNVGIAVVGGVVELAEADWDRVFAVNLKSAYLTMKHVIPVMERQGGGSIINISSIASIRYTGVPYATYYATKAALNQLTKTTAVEYAAKRSQGERHPAGADENADGRAQRGPRQELCRRRRRGDVARPRPPGADGISAAMPGTSPGRRCTWRATRAAMSPASNSWSTAASRSNTSEPRSHHPPAVNCRR